MQGNNFVAILDTEGNIHQVERSGNIHVGVDLQTIAELKNEIQEQQEVIENYYNKLVELGVIEVPKTAEEIALDVAEKQLKLAEETALNQQHMINNQNSIIEKMMQKMENIEEKMNKNGGEKHELFNENGIECSNSESGTGNRKKSK